jgi:hypothetical protein
MRKKDISLWSEVLERALSKGDDLKTSADDRDESENRFSVSDCARNMMEFNSRVSARGRT